MSTKDFYNAVTPGSSITHGTGLISESDYTKVTDAEIHSDALFLRCEVPVPNSILNKVKNDLIQRKMNIFLLMTYSIYNLAYNDCNVFSKSISDSTTGSYNVY